MSILSIAKHAGVSTATVSRVLNSVPLVSPSTVQAVREAMVALNYNPPQPRRRPSPRTGRRAAPGTSAGNIAGTSTGTFDRATRMSRIDHIGLMTVGRHHIAQRVIRSPVINAVVESVTHAAKQAGVQLLIDDVQTLDEVSQAIEKQRIDGAIVILADGPLDTLAAVHTGAPVVWAMGGHAGPLPVDHVSANNIAVGYLAHQYLHRRGCEDIAFLTADPVRRFAQQRRQALAGAAAESGRRALAFVVGSNPALNDLFGRGVVARPTLVELVEAFVNMSPRPTGLFIDRDATTAQVYPMLLKHGVQPGRDVTIVSCDNEEVRLAGLYPKPASIDLGTLEIGARAVRRLLLRIANPDEPPIFIQAMPKLIPGSDDLQA